MSRHDFRARVIERDSKRIATKWQGRCSCDGRKFTGPTFKSVEDQWRMHSGKTLDEVSR